MTAFAIDPLTAGAVVLATAATDAVYVMFTSAVISYTENWIYVCFAAVGSWIGAFVSITLLRRPPVRSPPGSAPE